MDEVENAILERVQHNGAEYSAVPEFNEKSASGCHCCAFEHDPVSECQSFIGNGGYKSGTVVYCVANMNPHGKDFIWIKTEEVPQYLVKVVLNRMENLTEE